MRVLDGKKTLTQLTNFANKKLLEDEAKLSVPFQDNISQQEHTKSHRIPTSNRT